MDEDETWHACRPRLPAGHILLDGTQLPLSPKGHSPPIFGPNLLLPNGWMHQMPLGREVARLGPSDIVLDGDTAPLPKKGTEPPISAHIFIVAERLQDGSRWQLARM